MLHVDDIALLRCPVSAEPLAFRGETIGERLWRGELTTETGRGWPVEQGIPKLFEPGAVGGLDRGFRRLYDVIAPLHDVSVRYALPLLQLSSERQLREFYMVRLELESIDAGSEPARILETGIGAGANVELLSEFLPADAAAEIWGIDLSLGMMRRAARRVAGGLGGRRIRFVQADAHHLPFPSRCFDRVFHVGAANTFSDPRRALAEMSRVAKPHTPIVLVDEQLDPSKRKNPYLWAGFRSITWYDRNPRAPVELLPRRAYDVAVEQINHFFYCMTWKMG